MCWVKKKVLGKRQREITLIRYVKEVPRKVINKSGSKEADVAREQDSAPRKQRAYSLNSRPKNKENVVQEKLFLEKQKRIAPDVRNEAERKYESRLLVIVERKYQGDNQTHQYHC